MDFPKQLGKKIETIAKTVLTEPFELTLPGFKKLVLALKKQNYLLKKELLTLLVHSNKFNDLDMDKEVFTLLLTELLLHFQDSVIANDELFVDSFNLFKNKHFLQSFCTVATENKDLFFKEQQNKLFSTVFYHVIHNGGFKALYPIIIDTPLFQKTLDERLSNKIVSYGFTILEAFLKVYNVKRTPFSLVEKETLQKILNNTLFVSNSTNFVELLRNLKSGDLLDILLNSEQDVEFSSGLSVNKMKLKDYVASILINIPYFKLDKKTLTNIAKSQATIYYCEQAFLDLTNGMKTAIFSKTLCSLDKKMLMLINKNSFVYDDKKVSFEDFLVNKLNEYIFNPKITDTSKEELKTIKQDIQCYFALNNGNKLFLDKIKGITAPKISFNINHLLKA